MTAWAYIENLLTVTATAAAIVALYALGAGGHAFWALLLLLNINFIRNR
jgi:hypothetical protein